MSTTISETPVHTLRVKLRDTLYERLCTQAARMRESPEDVARILLERALRRLPAAERRLPAA